MSVQASDLENIWNSPPVEGLVRGVPLVLYGAGNFSRSLVPILQSHGFEIAALLDERAQEIGNVHGVSCLHPDSPDALRFSISGYPVLIAVFNHRVDTRPIMRRLIQAGFSAFVPPLALVEAGFTDLPATYWMATREFLQTSKEDIHKVMDLWADDLSREIYLELLRLRMTGFCGPFLEADEKNQYFPADLPPLKNPVRFVDGGAFTGDTLESLSAHAVEAVVAFEPDSENFAVLTRTLEKLEPQLGTVCALPCGLGKTLGVHRFSGSRGAAGSFDDDGEIVTVVSLDETLFGFSPTYIKLDIEGAEMEALRGARRTIVESKPRLAVCNYHKPADFWEVPLMMKHLLPSHSLHLRLHGWQGFDSVVYAIEP